MEIEGQSGFKRDAAGKILPPQKPNLGTTLGPRSFPKPKFGTTRIHRPPPRPISRGPLLGSRRAQSSVTDALFFLLICSMLTALLFYFGTRYGEAANAEYLRNYQNDFAKSALKTLMYSSTPRQPGLELSDPNLKEIDYLIPMIKEDIARNSRVRDFNGAFRDNIEAIMRPFVGAFDYMVYIYVPEKGHFPFMMMHRSVFETAPTNTPWGADANTSARRDELLFCYPTGSTVWDNGYCLDTSNQLVPSKKTQPDCQGSGNTWHALHYLDDKQAIQRFRSKLGRVFDSFTFMQVFYPRDPLTPGSSIGSSGTDRALSANVVLMLWVPTQIDTGLLTPVAGSAAGPVALDTLNCYCDKVLLPPPAGEIAHWEDCGALSDIPSVENAP